ncbi:ABC-type bacteriocin/lantibiotic exporter, contains an N-terminal double-glycine peptidase domain [Streptacidiphilus jiangxiensis]|uniref:ABC-type bacteriocin/lantibiotic exporter, contains an N-terminal double-glycine peptidase domain n=1 Tax=Streptacidiphilus jiangxiensis TaxID=235985 RepID=A0A1H7KQR4_STRJI|nr:ABC-type bacteriocin/lantibiotic exporter, contains an N-terminal double-glycine peptidase domain [Streptacidiphilus jiangxiensis]
MLIRTSHFVVLEAVAPDGTVSVNDPGRGRYRQSGADFLTEFSGVALTFTGGAPARGGRARLPWVSICRAWLAPARRSVALAALLGLLGGTLLAAEALVLGRVAAGVATGHRVDGPALVAALAIAAAATAVGFGQRRLLTSTLAGVSAVRVRGLLERILTLPTWFTLRRPVSALLSQVRFAETAAVLLAHRVVPLVSGTAFLLPVTVVLYVLSPALALTAVIGVAAAGVLRATGDRRSAAPRRLLVNEVTRRNATAHAALSRMAAMHAAGSDSDLFAELTGLQGRDLHARDQAAARARPWQAAAAATETAMVAAACVLAAETAVAGSAAIGHAVGALVTLAPFAVTARTVVDTLQELPEFVGRIAVLDEVAEAVPEPRYQRHARADRPAPKLQGRLEVADLAFGYAPNRPPLLDGLDVTLAPGERIVLLGAAGSGTSTLLRLLVGALQPSRGRILLDGTPIQDLPREVLLGSVGYVPQTPCLYPASVADNVTLFDDAIDAAQVVRALRDACLDEVVARRGGPSVAQVAPGGRNFGGGERQRMALARALVREPSILLLDEPVSAVDPSLAARLDAMLRRRGVTVVVATQRAEMIGPADRVLRLENRRLTPSTPVDAGAVKAVLR